MPEESDRPERYFRLFLRGAESQTPTLLDFSGFLYDFNLLYEVSRLATDPAYDGFRFSRYVLYRRGRPLADRDRLRVEKLSQQSPLDLVTLLVAVPTAVGAWCKLSRGWPTLG